MRVDSISVRASFFLLALAGGCGRATKPASAPASTPDVVEAPLTSSQVTAARAAGYLPGLTPPYAALELLDDPVSIQSSNAPCTSGGRAGRIINDSGVVVGWDCRNTTGFGPQSAVAEYPLYSDPDVVGPLSNSIVNHVATYALPMASSARGMFPNGINDAGVIAGFAFTSATNSWGPYYLWGADGHHSTR